jgi:hypothetical protein
MINSKSSRIGCFRELYVVLSRVNVGEVVSSDLDGERMMSWRRYKRIACTQR